jgi:hypothetical protein
VLGDAHLRELLLELLQLACQLGLGLISQFDSSNSSCYAKDGGR